MSNLRLESALRTLMGDILTNRGKHAEARQYYINAMSIDAIIADNASRRNKGGDKSGSKAKETDDGCHSRVEDGSSVETAFVCDPLSITPAGELIPTIVKLATEWGRDIFFTTIVDLRGESYVLYYHYDVKTQRFVSDGSNPWPEFEDYQTVR